MIFCSDIDLQKAPLKKILERIALVGTVDRLLFVAKAKNVRVFLCSRDETKSTLGPEATTKYKTALNVAKRLPELADRLPAYRKAWMSEDQRINIFDAVALALIFFGKQEE